MHIATDVGHGYDSQVNYLRFDQTPVVSERAEVQTSRTRVRYASSRSARSGPSQGS